MTELSTVWASLAQGQADAAIAVVRRILHDQPSHVESLELLGAASFNQGDLATAIETYQKLTLIEPLAASHWLNLATAQRESPDLQAARASYLQAAARGAAGIDFHLNVGLLLWDLSDIDNAYEHLAAAYDIDADDTDVALAFGNLCCQTVRQQQALAVLGRWRHWRALAESQLVDLSSLLLQLGEMTEAEAVLRLALTLAPENLRAKVRLAGLMERLNQLEGAEALLAGLGHKLPEPRDAFEHRAMLARLAQRRGRHLEAVGHYQALLPGPGAGQDLQELHYSLARSLDALGRYDEAFAALEQAHAAQLKELSRYTPQAVAQPEPLRIADYSSRLEDIARWQPPPADRARPDPVFVVAFPRSGTTLLEQLLDAHPGLCAMDEQPFLQLAISDMQATGVQYPEDLAALQPAQIEQVRSAYWARVASKVTLGEGVRLVDKNPLNMLRLPAIRRLFPDARIILVARHPCDVLLSCFMQNFRAPEFAVLCRSLPSLVQGYRKAFEFWYAQQALLQGQVFELRYEAFVQDVPATARALVDFIGLGWDDRLLDPSGHARQRGYISTPSYAQVVKPVNRDAVGRWRRYAAQFEPLLPELEPLMKRWGYEA